MEVLWKSKEPVSVADVLASVRSKGENLSYSTIKAVLNNLSEKGYVTKCSAGRNNVFATSTTRAKFESQMVSAVLTSLIRSYREPVLAHLVDELGADAKTLDQLERLIAEKRSRKGKA
jgi:predicted transcriptional regulator